MGTATPELTKRKDSPLREARHFPSERLRPNRLRLFGFVLGVYLLRCAYGGTELEWFSSDAGEHVFQRGKNSHGVQIVVIAEVGDAEELALHLALAIRYNRAERVAEFFDDFAGVEPGWRLDCGKRGGRS